MSKVRRNFRFLRQEITFGISRDVFVDAFRVAILAAQNPLRVGSHGFIVGVVELVKNRGKHGFRVNSLPYCEYTRRVLSERLFSSYS